MLDRVRFAGPHGTADPLVCPSNPAVVDVVAFTATAVTSDPPTAVTGPWAMRLSNGQVCQLVSAAWGGLGPFSCTKAGAAQPFADCREPVVGPFWTTECQDEVTDASPFVAAQVVTVWNSVRASRSAALHSGPGRDLWWMSSQMHAGERAAGHRGRSFTQQASASGSSRASRPRSPTWSSTAFIMHRFMPQMRSVCSWASL